jgi:alpha-beta hydrolase superfamily lysophospholipase
MHVELEQRSRPRAGDAARECATPPVVVGHLLGGAIAARFASAQGDRPSLAT